MDQKLFFLINREWTAPGLDLLMATVSSFDFWVPILCVLIVCIALRGGFKARAMIVVAILVVGLSDGVAVNSLKHIVNRPRPTQLESVRVVDLKKAKPRLLAVFQPPLVQASHPEQGPVKDGRSFPSGHTTDNFAAAMVLTLFYPRRGWIYFFFAALVGYSRIYTGSHWPSDVLASAFFGAGLALMGVAGLENIWQRFGWRISASLFAKYPSLLKAGSQNS